MVKPSHDECCEGCGLAQYFNIAGGITAEQAVARAKLNLDFVREETIVEIDRALERIGLLVGKCKAVGTERPYKPLIEDAHAIHSVAGTFGFASLGVAAFMLREYLSQLERRSQWDLDGLELYYLAMRCLRGEAHSAACREILDGLQKLANRPLPPIAPSQAAAPAKPSRRSA